MTNNATYKLKFRPFNAKLSAVYYNSRAYETGEGKFIQTQKPSSRVIFAIPTARNSENPFMHPSKSYYSYQW